MGRILGTILILIFAFHASTAQEPPRVIQLTGVVFGKDSTSVVPGAHIYTPIAGRGTTTNVYGFFSMPVLEGDSLVFSAVGFKKGSYVVPEHKGDNSLQLLITLQEDVTYLDELEVFPIPSEEAFKSSVLALELPTEGGPGGLDDFINSSFYRQAYRTLPATPEANYRYFVQQQQQAYVNRFQPASLQLLNPFAWRDFFRSLKRNRNRDD